MLFSLKEFEHFFSDAMLRKGFQLFEGGKIRLLPGKIFQVGSKQVGVDKKADRLLSYSCTCGKSYNCEHLAALLFYLQRDSFNSKSDKKSIEAKQPLPIDAYGLALRETKNKDLKNFFKNRTKEIHSADLRKIFSSDVADDFELHWLRWKMCFKSYYNNRQIGDSDIDEILKMIAHTKAHTSVKSVGIELALLIELSELLGERFSGDENKIRTFCKLLFADLYQAFSKGLNEPSKSTWLRATINILRTGHLYYETLLFLLPRALVLSRSRHFFSELSVLLENLNHRRKYSEPYDNLRIAKWMLHIRQNQVFKIPLPQNWETTSVEYAIAASELLFCSDKGERGFKMLESFYNKRDSRQKRQDQYFRDHLIQKSAEYGNTKNEVFFLREALLFDLYILPEKLRRYLNLLDKKQIQSEIDNIIRDIKADRSPMLQDKINTLLFETGRFDDLIEELRKQDNAFLTLHKVALLKWPEYNEHLLNVYLKQLMDAFSTRRVFHRP
ncbi:MAG: SWIM zinc finger family protein, partial [Bacteroidia bacterium]|nr:SWIM zinc finger family protein [Bacteroidia bacterium]